MMRKAVGGWRVRVEGVQPRTGNMWAMHETGTPWNATKAKNYKSSQGCWHYEDGAVIPGQDLDARYDLQQRPEK